MKYGASLRAHSIPAWAHHNIDYDEIKAFIRENTTPGNGTAVSIPGTGDVRGQEVEDALFDILFQQHKRINLFVWSKTGEIKRRLDHLSRQTAELRSKDNATHVRVTAKRLERYGRLESDVLKAGEELRSLSRFIIAQQTAFRKLIKKYKKWSRSASLELSFSKEVLSDSASFTNADLDPLLAEWAETLDAVRILYEQRMGNASTRASKFATKPLQHLRGPQETVVSLREVLQSNSLTRFDTFVATLPLGDGGKNAVYWVHPDNVVELQVLLLQHARSFAVRKPLTDVTPTGTLSRHNSNTASPTSRRNSAGASQDTGLLLIDDEERFVREQSSTTLEAKEGTVGVKLQNAAVGVRWTLEDEAIIAAQSEGDENMTETPIKCKHLAMALDLSSDVPTDKAVASDDTMTVTQQIQDLQSWLARNRQIKPLAAIASNRQRFSDISPDLNGFLLATLDKSITMQKSSVSDISSIDTAFSSGKGATFPFAVLRIRQEGSYMNNLVRVLDSSHLVERVRGFSLEYHAVWHCCKPKNIVPPFWMPLMEKDIRKVPKLMGKRETNLINSGFGSQSTTPNMSLSGTSDSGNGDTTAVEEGCSNRKITIVDQLQTPRLSSFKKKRTRSYSHGPQDGQGQKQAYWSEYDNPSDSDGDGAYVLFIDPNAESGLSQTWSNFRNMFKNKTTSKIAEGSIGERSSSSDDESLMPRRSRVRRSYGTLTSSTDVESGMMREEGKSFWLPPLTMTCLGASVAILIVGYLLAMTGRRKQAQEVDAGIIFAVVSSLLFAISGVASLFGLGKTTVWAARLVALAVLAVDAAASGALLAWILA